jgi:hypothetical protein
MLFIQFPQLEDLFLEHDLLPTQVRLSNEGIHNRCLLILTTYYTGVKWSNSMLTEFQLSVSY